MAAERKVLAREQGALFNLFIRNLNEELEEAYQKCNNTTLHKREWVLELDFQKSPWAEAVSQTLQGGI